MDINGLNVLELAGRSETMRLSGPPNGRLFSVTYLPTSGTHASVVMCSSVLAEMAQNYRLEVSVARALAAVNIAVHRFHYRGTGDSEGETADLTLDTMLDDAIAATTDFTRGAPPAAFIGTRVGALVAAEAAAALGCSRLVLWDPFDDPSRWVREVLRASRMAVLAGGEAPQPEDLGSVLETRGQVDVLGYELHQDLCRSLEKRRLAQAIRPGSDVLVVSASRSGSLPSATQSFVSELEAHGSTADATVVPGGESWWLLPDADSTPRSMAAMAVATRQATVTWLQQHLQGP